MKRKLLIGLVGLVGGATVIGSGFSAWFFGNTALSDSGNIGVHVTDLNEGTGTLTNDQKDKTLTIALDQGGYANRNDATKGISVHEGTVNESDLTENLISSLSATYTISEDNATTLKNAGIHKATFKAVFTLTDTAATYVQFKDDFAGRTAAGSSLDTDKKVFTYTEDFDLEIETVADGKITETYTFDVSTTDTVNTMLEYKAKPTSDTDYNEMKTALTGDILSIAYSFTYTLPTA